MRTCSACQCAWAAAVTISALSAHYATVLMALPEGPAAKAVWNDIKSQELLNFLHEKRSESEAGNFKITTYNAVAEHIMKHLTHGPVKTGTMCKTKWNGVRNTTFIIIIIIYEYSIDEATLYCYRNLSKPVWLSLGLLSWSEYCWRCSRRCLEVIYYKGLFLLCSIIQNLLIYPCIVKHLLAPIPQSWMAVL
jgi:hypothetical protein